jgi:hypothetical protein
LEAASSAARAFVCYERKGDEDLPVGAIQESIEKKEVSVDEIVAEFRKTLEEWM